MGFDGEALLHSQGQEACSSAADDPAVALSHFQLSAGKHVNPLHFNSLLHVN